MKENMRIIKKVIRVGGILREINIIKDVEGKIIHKMISPLMVEFKLKDVLQVVVGASILSIPVSFTEEVWNLGEKLPLNNILGLLLISVIFVSAFVFFNFYKGNIKGHYFDFLKRAIFTYLISFGVVCILLTLIEKAPWQTDWLLAFKRAVIVALPASMAATIVDTIK